MLPKLLRRAHLGGQGSDVFDLAFGDTLEDVACPLFDERHERAMPEGPIGAAETECIGEGRDADGKV